MAATNQWVIKALALMTALSFMFIHFDDTKWSLPIIMRLLLVIGVARPSIYWLYIIPTIFSWAYLWLLVFNFKALNKVLTTLAVCILWGVIFYVGKILFLRANYQLVFDEESGWFYVPSIVFCLSSLLLFYASWRFRED